MKIHLATDHAGFELKEKIRVFLQNKGYNITDHGACEYDGKDDYPDYIFPAAHAVANDANSFGIILGGSGQGEAMAANRIKGARAAVYYGGNEDIIDLSRIHNNANILSLGARFLDFPTACIVIERWLKGSFEGGRHEKRIQKLDNDS